MISKDQDQLIAYKDDVKLLNSNCKGLLSYEDMENYTNNNGLKTIGDLQIDSIKAYPMTPCGLTSIYYLNDTYELTELETQQIIDID